MQILRPATVIRWHRMGFKALPRSKSRPRFGRPKVSKEIRDHGSIYGAAFKKQLAALNIRDGPTALRSPWQSGFVERIIGSIKRECHDHIIIRDEAHLRCVLKAYVHYYNRSRTHLSLAKNAHIPRPIQRSGKIEPFPHLGGLHHDYVRIE